MKDDRQGTKLDLNKKLIPKQTNIQTYYLDHVNSRKTAVFIFLTKESPTLYLLGSDEIVTLCTHR